MANTTKPLTNLQLELLKTFNFDLKEEQLMEIRKLLVDYFAQKITKDMDELFEEKGWDDSKLEKWSSEHMRTPYHDKK